MRSILAELEETDRLLADLRTSDLESMQKLLDVRRRLLDRLRAAIPTHASLEMLAQLQRSARMGDAAVRRLMSFQHQLSMELGRLSQQQSFTGALIDQAPPVTTGLDCSG